MNSLVVYDVSSGADSDSYDSPIDRPIKTESTDSDAVDPSFDAAHVLKSLIDSVCGDSIRGSYVSLLPKMPTDGTNRWLKEGDWPKPAVPIKEEPYQSDSDFGSSWRIDRELITSDSSGVESLDELLGEHSEEFRKKHRKKRRSTANAKSTALESDDSDEDLIFAKVIEFTRQKRLEAKKEEVGPEKFAAIERQIKAIPRTRGEFRIEDLPPIEKLSLNFDHEVQFARLGVITAAVETLVVTKADFDLPPLNDKSVLFIDPTSSNHDPDAYVSGKVPLGLIFETFGPVPRPMYSVRFNTDEEIKELALSPGKTIVYFAPKENQITKTVFTDALRKMKGSDASWQGDNEPPIEHVEFSDDEEERRFKAKQRRKHAHNREADEAADKTLDVSEDSDDTTDDVQITHQSSTRGGRGRGRGNRRGTRGNNRAGNRGRGGNTASSESTAGPPFPQMSEFQARPQFCWPPRGGPQQQQRNPHYPEHLQYPIAPRPPFFAHPPPPHPSSRGTFPNPPPFRMPMSAPIFTPPPYPSPFENHHHQNLRFGFPQKNLRGARNMPPSDRGQQRPTFPRSNWNRNSGNSAQSETTDSHHLVDTRYMETE